MPSSSAASARAGCSPNDTQANGINRMSDLPSSVRYLVVGAGMHGLSTAWHLAMKLEQTGRGKGSDVLLIDKTGPGRGRHGRRLRLCPQPLHDQPAAHDPAPFGRCLAVRSGQFRLPAGGLRLGRRGQPVGRLRDHAQEPERRRLCLGRLSGQGRQGLPQGALAGLQHRARRLRPAREAVWLCRHPHRHRRPRRQVPAVGRRHALGRRGPGLRS